MPDPVCKVSRSKRHNDTKVHLPEPDLLNVANHENLVRVKFSRPSDIDILSRKCVQNYKPSTPLLQMTDTVSPTPKQGFNCKTGISEKLETRLV